MRVAIVSDVHGNRTAFEAVLADLRRTSPDLILHGGDLADGGASPVEIVDWIRDLGWAGVLGNADEMLFDPESLAEFAKQFPNLQSLFTAVADIASATRDALGEERLAWLSTLPRLLIHDRWALVHASPDTTWRAPLPEATDAEFQSTYASVGKENVVYAHIHRPLIRKIPRAPDKATIVANTGSVSLSYDGDPRASYLLLDDDCPSIRRVEYNIWKEIKALSASKIPHANWIAKMLETSRPQMPN